MKATDKYKRIKVEKEVRQLMSDVGLNTLHKIDDDIQDQNFKDAISEILKIGAIPVSKVDRSANHEDIKQWVIQECLNRCEFKGKDVWLSLGDIGGGFWSLMALNDPLKDLIAIWDGQRSEEISIADKDLSWVVVIHKEEYFFECHYRKV